VSLSELASIANREHHLAKQAAKSMALHSLAAGEALNRAKDRVKHGEWGAWLRENFDGSQRSAQRYMRIAANAPRVAHLDLESMSLGALDRWLASASYPPEVETQACADCGACAVTLYGLPGPLPLLGGQLANLYCQGCARTRFETPRGQSLLRFAREADQRARVLAFSEVLHDLGDAFGPGTSYAAGLREALAKLEREAKGVASEFPGALDALDATVSEIEEVVAGLRAYADEAGDGGGR
jgi:Protein of unknown function (DUF3102)